MQKIAELEHNAMQKKLRIAEKLLEHKQCKKVVEQLEPEQPDFRHSGSSSFFSVITDDHSLLQLHSFLVFRSLLNNLFRVLFVHLESCFDLNRTAVRLNDSALIPQSIIGARELSRLKQDFEMCGLASVHKFRCSGQCLKEKLIRN